MSKPAYPRNKNFPYFIVAIEYALYVALFVLSFELVGWAIGPLAMVSVSTASWYFRIKGGMLMAILSIVTNMVLPAIFGHSPLEFIENSGNLIGSIALLFLAVIIGRLGTVTRERRDAILRLEKLEKEHLAYTSFLEFLNQITRMTLGSDELKSTLGILVEQIAKLFKADDCFFARWDEANAMTIPVVAYGPLSDIYPQMHFEPGERTLTASIMEASHPIAISNLGNSTHINPKVASLFPSSSMLGLPLIVQGRKLGALILGYNQNRIFAPDEISRAEIAAEQIALVVSKSQLLEEAQSQVKQLTVLHEVALISTQAETVDRLLDQVTDIIGRNLFPDNFGILLMDEERGMLHPHPSYRFGSAKDQFPTEIPLGQGVSGQVAKTGQLIRTGNVAGVQNYLNVDQMTSSELCVPIKLKNRVLGVINTESKRVDAFSTDDEFLLGTLAGQLATAIEQLRAAEAERKWLDQLAHSNDLIYSIAQITTQVERALTMDEIIKTLGDELHHIGLTCIMAVYNADQSLFTVNYTSLTPHFLEIVENGLGYPLIHYTFSRDKLNHALGVKEILHPTAISNPEVEIQILFDNAENLGIVRILQEIGVKPGAEPLRLPLVFEENLLGILWIWGEGITKSDLPIMSIFAKQIGISLERARLFQEVQSLALTDPLTGLHNRRSFFQLGKVEFSRAQRMDRPLSCMMLDLDHFKQVNDNYGHPAGDQILQEFAKRCKDSVREIDLVGRYGGEEIIILLPETDLITALQIAERMCAAIGGTPMKILPQEINVTASIGVSAKDENTDQLETLIARADQAMYIAKHKGRNLVAISR